MPSTYSSIHQYPSVQTMRKVDLRQTAVGFGSVRREDPSIHVKDFQRDYSSESERKQPSSNASASTASMPSDINLPHRSGHFPLRSSSRNDLQSSSHFLAHRDSISTIPMSSGSSHDTYETQATSLELAPLQARGPLEGLDQLDPLQDYDPGSFDLVLPPATGHAVFSLEERSQQLFSREHLQVIFSDPSLLLRFTAFLSTARPTSVPILVYYLDALKALKAIAYANAICEGLEPISGHEFTNDVASSTINTALEEKASSAFNAMVQEDLPAYITHMYVRIASLSITKRITGTLAPHLREASEGLAEVFCLSDPSRPDNPIIFASEEFHRTTQYGMNYAIGRNCRFLQGPKTSPFSVRRIREAVQAGKEQCEVFLNYRRDGSPFMNLLMVAPLCDSRGTIRYFVGAQIDVSGLVKDCTDLESLEKLVIEHQSDAVDANKTNKTDGNRATKDEFRELSEMLSMSELETVRRWGGRMHREQKEKNTDTSYIGLHRPRLLLKEQSIDLDRTMR